MIAGTYILSGVLLAGTGLFLGDVTAVTLTLMGCIIFFFASAGASAAYLTASEVFPMETRALCIAFFYAIGTAAGGITGPLYFGKLIDDAGDITKIALGYFVGAALMIAGGIVAAFLGVKAEGKSLESLAQPLTAEDADDPDPTTEDDATRETTTRPSASRRTTMTPMPPPKASTEGPRDRHVHHEIGQLVRALQAQGPQRPDELGALVGAEYWESGTLRPRALALAVSDGLITRQGDGRVAAVRSGLLVPRSSRSSRAQAAHGRRRSAFLVAGRTRCPRGPASRCGRVDRPSGSCARDAGGAEGDQGLALGLEGGHPLVARRPTAARTSRCTRFLAVLPSGTFWNHSRGPTPSGSTDAEASLRFSSGMCQASSASSQVSYGGGGLSSR